MGHTVIIPVLRGRRQVDPWGLLASQLCLISNLQKETLLKNKIDSMEKQHPRWFSGLAFIHMLEHSHKYIRINKHVYANTHTYKRNRKMGIKDLSTMFHYQHYIQKHRTTKCLQ